MSEIWNLAGGRFLVTGASGYVGQELVRDLLKRGANVRAYIRDVSKAKGLQDLGAEIALGDLRDQGALDRACEAVDGVFHIGAVFRQANLIDDDYRDINATGTRRALDAAIKAGVRRFVHCSTGGVLGHIANPPGNENSPYNPGDIYQVTKLEGEKIALEYFKAGKISGCVIRPAMIYGPGDTRNYKLFKMLNKGLFFYVGPGNMSVHFVDVRDLVSGFILAMQHTERNAEVYHIAGRTPVSLREFVKLVCEKLQVSEPWLHLPVKPMQILGLICEKICIPLGINPPIYKRRVDFFTKNRHFDYSKAQRELGYQPAKSLGAELDELIQWYREQGML